MGQSAVEMSCRRLERTGGRGQMTPMLFNHSGDNDASK
jgi:hypothetical protein